MVHCQIVFKWQWAHLIWSCMQSLGNTNIKLTCIIPWVCIYLSCIDCVISSMFVSIAPRRRWRDCGVLFRFWGVCLVRGYWATRQALLTCYHYIAFHSCRWSLLPLCYDACVRSYTCLPYRHILPYPTPYNMLLVYLLALRVIAACLGCCCKSVYLMSPA